MHFLDIHNSILGYPSISRILDIQKWILGYPKIELWVSKIQHDLWISKKLLKDFQKYIQGYPKLNYVFPELFKDIQF